MSYVIIFKKNNSKRNLILNQYKLKNSNNNIDCINF